ncbi:MAG: alpha/beta fold hydrolase, partial [bacterium]
AFAASPPEQPLEGPGGQDYFHNKVIKSKYGMGPSGYYIFEPGDPRPDTAPLIILIHGFTAVTPSAYEAWIDHLVKKGNIVVYPVYQFIIDASHRFPKNTINATLSAIEELQTGDHVRPDLDRFAAVGHSMGGILAADLAALAEESGLPMVKAVMSVQPGVSPMPPMADLSKIPADTLLLSVVGDADIIARTKDAKKIYRESTQVPPENKDYIIMSSDRNGRSSLLADHFAPVCIGTLGGHMPMFGVDALDYYCLWKLFDALTDAAFYGLNREYALGNTPEQRYMGEWSDGTPVKEMIVTDNP